MDKNYRAELVGVFGDPVEGNPTGVMEEAGFEHEGLNYRYLTIKVLPEDLDAAMAGLKAFNMRGINLTMPHKINVLKHMDELSEAARIIGAVNTVVRREDGTLFGEALVITREDIKRDFRYIIKQKGGMLAKGRLLGVQFGEALRDGLYMELSRHAIDLAMRLKTALTELGVPFMVDSPTNQQFPILPDALLTELKRDYSYATIARIDATHTAVRFCTSWATREEDVDRLISDLRDRLKG